MQMAILFMSFTLVLISCDTVTVPYSEGSCIEHKWYSGVFKIQKIEGINIKLKNIITGESKTISEMDQGWRKVDCVAKSVASLSGIKY